MIEGEGADAREVRGKQGRAETHLPHYQHQWAFDAIEIAPLKLIKNFIAMICTTRNRA